VGKGEEEHGKEMENEDEGDASPYTPHVPTPNDPTAYGSSPYP